MKIFIILSCAYGFISMMDLELLNFVIEYVNPSFYNAVNVSIRRPNRHSLYSMNVYLDYKHYVGDNFTIKVNVYDVIGGRNILTPIRLEYTICYFLRQDALFGKIFSQQLPRNLTCPFAPGIIDIKHIILHTEQLPPITLQVFTYSSLNIKICVEIEGLYLNERVYLSNTYWNVKFKLNNRQPKNKASRRD